MAKAPADIRFLARGYTKTALQTSGGIAETGTSEAARVAAAIALLDRGWGKPPQSHTGQDSEGPIIVEIVHRPRCSDRDEPKLVEHVTGLL